MAYFNLKNTGASLSFNSVNLTCLQSVEVTGSAPSTEIECSGSSAVTYITGVPRYQISFTGALDEDDVTLLNGIDINESGAVALNPAGTGAGTIDIASTNGTISDLSVSLPISGFSTYSGTILCDDLTFSANGA